MKWLDKWAIRRAEHVMLNDKINNMSSNIKMSRDFSGNTISPSTREIDINTQGMNFKIYKASGGIIIETNMYDRRTDRHNNGLYIVTDDKDLGKEIGKIITMESLKSWLVILNKV